MRIATLLPLAVLAACSSDSSNEPSQHDAKRTFSAANSALEAASRSLGARARLAAPAAGSVDVTDACSQGGSITLAGTYDAGSDGSSIDVDASFDGCQEDEGALDGTLHWTSNVDGVRVEYSWIGTLTLTDATGTWQCAFDLSLIVDETGVHYAGSLCGYDVETDLDLEY